jgi:hypothetical protein
MVEPGRWRSDPACWIAKNRAAIIRLMGSCLRRAPGASGEFAQSCSLSQAPTFGHRFWLADRPTTIPT